MTNQSTKRVWAILILFLGPLLIVSGCSEDKEEPLATSTETPGLSTDGSELVAVLESLPVFPKAQLEDGRYPTAAPFGDYLSTEFEVETGTTLDEITSFFEEGLPSSAWALEAGPWKDSGQTETVITTFLNVDGIRLAVLVPMVHKDASPGVTSVQLILAPKEVELFASPVATGIESTPPSTSTHAPGPTISALPTPGPSVESTPVGQVVPARTSSVAATGE